tara:strand:+ start:270 stop:371 length:102 start_codon:yes stop_codon:yes gene_type:complete
MTKDEVQLEALAATDGKRRCSVVLGTVLTFKSE